MVLLLEHHLIFPNVLYFLWPSFENFAWFQKNPNLGFRDITFEQHQFVRCMITYCHQKRCDYNILKNHVHSFFRFWAVVGYMASQSLRKTLYITSMVLQNFTYIMKHPVLLTIICTPLQSSYMSGIRYVGKFYSNFL